MKKFFAGVSVLAVIVSGLAGCGNSVDRDQVWERYRNRLIVNAPDYVKAMNREGDLADCLVEGTFDDFTDEQVEELDKLLDTSLGEGKHTPEWFDKPFEKALKACKEKVL